MLAKVVNRLRHDRWFKWEMIVLAGMYLGYAALILCRSTVVNAGPSILDDPSLGLTKTAWGDVLGWGTAGLLAGKLVNGVLADRFGGRRIFILSLTLCMLATGIFGTMSGVAFFSIAFFFALFAKSAGWPAMANLIGVWYPANWRGRIWGILSSSSRLSSVFSTLVIGSLFLVMSWQSVIGIAVALAGGVLIFLFLILKQSPADVGLEARPSFDGDDPAKPHHLDQATLGEALLDFAKSPRVWLICASIMSLAVLMEFQSFIGIYLKEMFRLKPGIAVMASSAFPVGCLISVLLGGFVFDLLNKKMRIFILGGLMVMVIGCILMLLVLPSLELASNVGLAVSLLSILLFGVAIAPCYYIPMSVFSIDYGGKHCGVLVSIIDAMGYLAAMTFDFMGGRIVDQADGWHQFLIILLYVAIVGFVVLSMFLYLEHRSQTKEVTS
jgi:sugar phosphate permease